jgi:hypothetical protein
MENTNENITRFEISEFDFSDFENAISKMTRKAAKLGLPAVGYNRVEVLDKVRVNKNTGAETHYNAIVVDIFGTNAVLEGWRFIASLEHTENGNLVRGYFETVDTSIYRNTLQECEHCLVNRQRNLTYIVQNVETGEFKQVGSTCLADFIGTKNAAAVALFYASMQSWKDWSTEEDEDDNLYSGHISRGEVSFSLVDYLAYVNRSIARFGWKGSNCYGEYNTPTKWDALNEMFHSNEYEKLEAVKLTEEEVNNSKAILDAVKSSLAEKSNLNDYEWNVSTLINNRMITYNHIGYAASIATMWARIQGWKREQVAKAEGKVSNHVGVVGEKIYNITVKLVKWNIYDGGRFMSYIYIFEDASGNKMTWFSSNKILDDGDLNKDIVLAVATVKEHGEFRGVKQTIITRCKIA